MRARQESGYIALLAVLILGAVATAIGLALLTIGADSQRAALVEQRSKQARVLATACAQEALQQIHDNIAYSGTNTLSIGQGNCTYTVAVTAGTTRSIVASGTVGSVVRKAQVYVTIGTSTISVSSWQETSS
ncbi:MAG TPA: hypothetical protein VLG11_00950 [Candidatus Saccharimonadales bacterium]|nr:hypothetical protein [Candidatus Saccharimonadales bacterium]